MKSTKSGEHLSFSFNVGGCLAGIINITLIGCISEYGGLPSYISIQVIPKLHISAEQS
jgi:hypothetical protein